MLDIFDVEGGDIHEWMAQGSCMADGTLEVSVPTEYYGESYAHDRAPFEPPMDVLYRKERRDRGLHPHRLEPGEEDPWYGVFRNVHRGEMTGGMTARFGYSTPETPVLRLHVLAPDRAQVYTCTVPSLRRAWSDKTRQEEHERVEQFRMPKLILRRDGSDLSSRFVVLWESTHGAEVVERVENLAPGDPDLVALDIHTAGGGEVIRTLYSSRPDRRHCLDDGVEFQGRYAVIRSAAQGKHLSLYDTLVYRDGDLALDMPDRPPLPLTDVVERDGSFVVGLKGTWGDIAEGEPLAYAEPELVFLIDGAGHQRAFPVDSVESVDDRTLLRCNRHPGFEYNAGSEVLKERFFPFHTVGGKVLVGLADRMWLRPDASGGWMVRTTGPLTLNGEAIGRTDAWVSISR